MSKNLTTISVNNMQSTVSLYDKLDVSERMPPLATNFRSGTLHYHINIY